MKAELAAIARAQAAYFKMVNDQGGVAGRKINFISLDDGYNPAKTVEQVRKLVEEEEVLLIFAALGTPPNSAIHKYMNQKKVPQLFVATGATLLEAYQAALACDSVSAFGGIIVYGIAADINRVVGTS